MPTKSRSATITELREKLQPGDRIPVELIGTPGDTLKFEFLDEMGITPSELAKAIGVPRQYIFKILNGGGVSPEVAVLLDKYFGLSDGWWLRYQANYESKVARWKLADKLAQIEPRVVQQAA